MLNRDFIVKKAIKRLHGSMRARFQNVLLEAVLRRKPYDYVSLAYLRAAMEAAEFFVDQMPLAEDLKYKKHLLTFAASQAQNQGLWLEFGVFKGRDIRVLSSYTDRSIYGFDSFEGLPEDWTFFQRKGRFSLSGQIPKVPTNVKLVKGWFQDTLPPFLESHPEPVAFLHIDSDLYSSASYVLEKLSNRLVPGTIILFDDFLNYPAWREGEAKAFFEFLQEAGKTAEYIGFSSRQQAVAVRVLT